MERKLHIIMYPWFAMGHMTPFLHLANHLAERGHRTTLLLPNKAKLFLDPSNHHPSLITLQPITVPHVDPLPLGTQTASEIPLDQNTHLCRALDMTRPEIETLVSNAMPADFLFFDFAYWAPDIANKFGIKSVYYSVVCAASIAACLVPAYNPDKPPVDENGSGRAPPGYPSNTVVFRGSELDNLNFFTKMEFGSGLTFYQRNVNAMLSSDIIAVRTTKETEECFCDYLCSQYKKPVLLSGPILPEPGSDNDLDPKWAEWLDRFEPGSVVFCAFGSQFILEKDQFQELLLGFEMTKLPFFVALKPPIGCTTVDEALPEGFKERVGNRGVVHGGWVQQPLILANRSVGCFVNHCGFGSMWESLLSDNQIVLIPQLGDQILNTRLLVEELKVGVEVEKQSNVWVSKENLYKAIKCVMDEGNEVGDLVRKNHAKWRETLANPDLMRGYIDNFIKDVVGLLD